MSTDKNIQQNVSEELTYEPSVDDSGIRVSVENGTVTLDGKVSRFSEKLAAETAALAVTGVASVKNNLEVELSGDFKRADAAIKDAAERSLEWNSAVPADAVSVTVKDGHIILEGTLKYHYQKDAARNAVTTLAGVTGVSDKTEVKSNLKPQNPEEELWNALKRDAVVDASRVRIEIEGNRATLHGTLRSWAERRRAERAARNVPGIYEVNNNIAVSATS